ncbi:MAG: flavin reductase family protein [Oricola sp.]
MFFEPEKGHDLPYNPFKAIVAPRPIGWVSTRGRDGTPNLAPYSFFNAVSDTPPIVLFSSSGRKDSVTNAEETGEFVCNFVGEAQFREMSQTSFAYERGISEFPAAGLEEAECRLVKAPRVAQAPAALECVVTEIRQVKSRAGETNNWMVFGEVVGIHVDDAMMTNGRFDLAKARPVTRLGYLDYGMGTRIVELARPKIG